MSVPEATSREPIDLFQLGHPNVIASYLVETDEGFALFDCGPSSTAENLEAGLRKRGLALTDIKHLLLSHIHLDHAGATGVLVRKHPALQVHVSAIGAPHLIDPSKLERSARRIYGEAFDQLWGELAPVPEENVHLVGESVLGLECFPTPGHAVHHVCYLHRDGTLYAGDAAGVRIQPSDFVLPPTPPPDIDVDVWHASLDEIERRSPERLALIHFGFATDIERHIVNLRLRLDEWAALVVGGATEEEFVRDAQRELEDANVPNPEDYAQAIPFNSSYHGLKRWTERRVQAA
jgi:glyoxylase-like metal-dependent hydrolase (beta-lactamase superfamily II)